MSKKNNKNKDSNWEYLERLAFHYVSKKYTDEVIKSKTITPNSHDGGYDAVWLIEPLGSSSPYHVLMEAKLRNTQSTLSMNDCAKSIIIAFNLSAKELYIVTNIGFAPQTQIQTTKFQNRTNLHIECVSGKELKDYIISNWNELTTEKKIPQKFLKSMIEYANSIKVTNKNIYSNEVQLPRLIGKNHNKIVDDITEKLIANAAICLITGEAGIGKSTILKAIMVNMKRIDFDVNTLDLSLYVSIRTIFLKLLELIWGVSLFSILNDVKLDTYVDELLQTSDREIEFDVFNSVKQALLASLESFNGQRDIYTFSFISFIQTILHPRRESINLVIEFTNINMASCDLLDFLIQAIKVLRDNNIRVLIEVRTPFIFGNTEDYILSRRYFNLLINMCDFHEKVPPLTRFESIQLIHQYIPLLNSNVCDSLSETLGDNPLDIVTAAVSLTKEPLLYNNLNQMNINQLLLFWNDSHITRNTVILQFVEMLRLQNFYAEVFELAILFRGEIPIKALKIISFDNYSEVVKLLLESTSFIETPAGLKCKHLRFLDAMKKTSSPIVKYSVSEKLLDSKEQLDIFQDSQYMPIEVELLYSCNRLKLIPEKTKILAQHFILTYQFSIALEYMERCIQQFIVHFQINQPLWYIEMILVALYCIRELHESNNKKYEYLFKEARNAIYYYHSMENSPRSTCLVTSFLLYEWYKVFTNGDFLEAFNISKSLYDKLPFFTSLSPDSEDYIGQIYNAYGLSIKMKEGGDNAENIFVEGSTKYPNAYYAKVALLSQQGNRLLKSKPLEAVSKYREILHITRDKKYPYQEILHTRIDIAMSYFLGEEYEKAIDSAQQGIDIAASLGIWMQRGRALNILGCCYAAFGELMKSRNKFQEAIFDLEFSLANIYLWRAKLNLATLLLIDKDTKEDGKKLLDDVTKVLINNFYKKINSDEESVPYKAAILLIKYYEQLGDTSSSDAIKICFANGRIPTIIEEKIARPDWQTWFNSKVKRVGNFIFITG